MCVCACVCVCVCARARVPVTELNLRSCDGTVLTQGSFKESDLALLAVSCSTRSSPSPRLIGSLLSDMFEVAHSLLSCRCRPPLLQVRSFIQTLHERSAQVHIHPCIHTLIALCAPWPRPLRSSHYRPLLPVSRERADLRIFAAEQSAIGSCTL